MEPEKSPAKTKRHHRWGIIVAAFTAATVIHAIRAKQATGTFMKVPYDFRVPTLQRLRERFWNPDDARIFTPRFFGVGWSLNVYRLRERLKEAFGSDDLKDTPEEPQD